ncbi:MAG: hypothetical protein KC684_02000 [Candidatus Omnitrophica bacterium]|nr:hypothetical protein [Candidatus Omnitrophota bacterium]
MIAPQINSLVVAQQYDYALHQMRHNKESYGPQNELLYQLDYGMVLHLAGEYQNSVVELEKAKKIYDQLYTVSVTNQASTWLINDNKAPYRGEDFERVTINIIQALNFAVLGDFEKALVEARDVDWRLKLINQQYKEDQQNVYRQDAFARLLMGIMYEAEGSLSDLNDAYISYAKAVEAYSDGYYDVPIPLVLKENILAAAEVMGREEFDLYHEEFGDVPFISLKERAKKAEVYVIHHQGLSPVKHPVKIPIPLPNGFITQLAFPAYHQRTYEPKAGKFEATAVDSGINRFVKTEQATAIDRIAIQSLNSRKLRVIAKAALRSGAKHMAARALEAQIEEGAGETTGNAFRYVSNLYNIVSEQPDLRSWQTLPAEIRIARLILDPGEYKISFNGVFLGNLHLSAGEKRFVVVRTNL